MKISNAGIDLIEEFEGVRLTAYPDPATGGDPWTIGVGHTGPDVVPGLTITAEEASDLLLEDLEKTEEAVSRLVTVPLEQHQFDALVSLIFNIGAGAFGESTLLHMLNKGQYNEASAQFLRWNQAGGAPMTGLTRRRVAERALFDGAPIPPVVSQPTILSCEEAIRRFQASRGLVADAIVGPLTQAALGI